MPEVRLSLEEYLALIGDTTKGTMVVTRSQEKPPRMGQLTLREKPKRKGKKDPKMARALKKANSIGRTKSGKLRKGYTQARIMKKAHQLRRKM